MWQQHVQEFGPTGAATSFGQDNGGRGWLGTVQVGCDYQILPSIVIGAFGDFDWSNLRGDAADGLIVGSERMRWAASAGGRVGWVAWPQLLVYVAGGWTEARFNRIDFGNLFVGGAIPAQFIEDHTNQGWFIGTGYEYNISFLPGLSWKTEYRLSDYGTD